MTGGSAREHVNVLPIKPFIQVCVHTAISVQRDAVKKTAEDILANLDQGADLPKLLFSQVPLFADACKRLGAPRSSKTIKTFMALSLREARRNSLMLDARQDLMSAVRHTGVDAAEMRGPMLGHVYYPARDLRHTHALKFVVFREEQRTALIKELRDTGWVFQPKQLKRFPHYVSLVNQTGVEAQIYNRLVPHSAYEPSNDIMSSLSFQMAMVLCQAPFERQQRALRWVSDLVFLSATKRVEADLVASIILELGLPRACFEKIEFCLSLIASDAEDPRQDGLTDVLRKLSKMPDHRRKNSLAASLALRRYGDEQSQTLRSYVRRFSRSIAKYGP